MSNTNRVPTFVMLEVIDISEGHFSTDENPYYVVEFKSKGADRRPKHSVTISKEQYEYFIKNGVLVF